MASKTQYFCDICGREVAAPDHSDIALGPNKLAYKIPGKDWLNGRPTNLCALVCANCRAHISATVTNTIGDILKGRL